MKLCLLVIATSLVIAVTSQMGPGPIAHNSNENGTEETGIDVSTTKLATIRRNLTQTAPEGRAKLDLLRRDTNNTTSGGSTKSSNGYQQGPPGLDTMAGVRIRAELETSNATKTTFERDVMRGILRRDINNTTSGGSTKLSNGYQQGPASRDTMPGVKIRAEQNTSNATKTTSEGGVKQGILRRDINNTTSGGSTKLSNGYQQGPASRDTIPEVSIRAEQKTSNATKTPSEGGVKRGILRRDINNTTSGGSTKLSNGHQQGPPSLDTMPGVRLRAELETSNATKRTFEGDVLRGILRRDINNTTSGGSTKLSNGYQQGLASRDTIPQVRIRAKQNVSNATKTTSEGRFKRGMLLRDTNNTTSAGSTKLRNANNIYGGGYKWERTRRDTNTTTSRGSTQLSIDTKATEDGYKQKVTGQDTMPDVRIGTKTTSGISTKLSNATKTSEDGYKRKLLRRDTNQTTSGRVTNRTIVISRTQSDGGNKRELARRDINQTVPVELRPEQVFSSRDTDKRQIVKKAETTPNPGPTELPDGDDSFNTFSYTGRQV